MSEDVREYTIKTLEDILQLDERQREAFIVDLREWLKFMDNIPDMSGIGIKLESQGMVWIDDNAVGLTGVNLTAKSAPN